MTEMVTSGSMSGEVETERWITRREQQRKTLLDVGAADPVRHRAPLRLYWRVLCSFRFLRRAPGAAVAPAPAASLPRVAARAFPIAPRRHTSARTQCTSPSAASGP